MPIIDIEVVGSLRGEAASASARKLADVLGDAFGSAPGHTWVRLRWLDAAAYAENRSPMSEAQLPVFVTVLHAQLPAGDALAVQALAVTRAVAQCLSCPPERVHVQYAPPAAGRQAFGGVWVR